jgi:hypothetical protein
MKPNEMIAAARATCSWLNYKSLVGFEPFLSEAMLKVPISEYLAAETTWSLKTEFGYQKLPGSEGLRSFYCDFAATKKYGTGGIGFLLETKFLKRSIDSVAKHLAADVLRLALPQSQKLTRLFLLAGRTKHFQSAKPTFIFENVFKLGRQKGCDIKFAEVLTDPDFLKSYPIYTKPIQLTNQRFVSPLSAYVQCRSVEQFPDSHDGFKVMIWSISRAKLTDEAYQGWL